MATRSVCGWFNLAPSELHRRNVDTIRSRSWNFSQGVWGVSLPWRGRKSVQAQRRAARLHTPAELRLESPGAWPSMKEPDAVHTLTGWACTDRLGKDSPLRWIVTLMVTAPLLPPKGKKTGFDFFFLFLFLPGHSSTSRSPIRFYLGPAVWLWDWSSCGFFLTNPSLPTLYTLLWFSTSASSNPSSFLAPVELFCTCFFTSLP